MKHSVHEESRKLRVNNYERIIPDVLGNLVV